SREALMASIFDKITKALTLDDTEEKPKGILGKTKQFVSEVFKPEEKFEWAVKEIKKYSEKKTQFSSEISNLEHEFGFYDESLQRKMIESQHQIVSDKKSSLAKLMASVMSDKRRIERLEIEIEKQQGVIKSLGLLPSTEEEKKKLNDANNHMKDLRQEKNDLESAIPNSMARIDQLRVE
ncbi:MAG: hypothetical protein JXO44_13505, partial [Clostridia bacterium]|nr:hypothetical protein [Clostridia bacterium]